MHALYHYNQGNFGFFFMQVKTCTKIAILNFSLKKLSYSKDKIFRPQAETIHRITGNGKCK